MDISNLTLREKIGQLMMFGFDGITPSKEIVELIEEHHVGGIILFGRNIGTAKEALELTYELQKTAKKANHQLPLLISTDQENGIVRRLGTDSTTFPGNMLLGATLDINETYKAAKATAEELKALGINMNLAPVIDINNNPNNPVIGVRSFGEDAIEVANHGIASVNGHFDAKVISTIKHFPGHGDTEIDSHLALPVIPHSLERLQEVELVPFKKMIAAGAEAVMIAHVYFPGIDGDLNIPATTSRNVITDLLRDKLGYNKVIVTDCLEMKAIADGIGTTEAALMALQAGADLLMISHSYDLQKKTISRIENAVIKGELTEDIIDRAVQRIATLKEKYLNWGKILDLNTEVLNRVGSEEHRTLAMDIYRKGITLIKNDGLLPLESHVRRILIIYPENRIYTLVEELSSIDDKLKKAIKIYNNCLHTHTYKIIDHPGESEVDELIELSFSYDIVIFTTISLKQKVEQVALINRLVELRQKVIVISLRTPYDYALIPNVNAFIVTYEHSLPAISVAFEIIMGLTNSKGRLPVSIPGYFAKGYGL